MPRLSAAAITPPMPAPIRLGSLSRNRLPVSTDTVRFTGESTHAFPIQFDSKTPAGYRQALDDALTDISARYPGLPKALAQSGWTIRVIAPPTSKDQWIGEHQVNTRKKQITLQPEDESSRYTGPNNLRSALAKAINAGALPTAPAVIKRHGWMTFTNAASNNTKFQAVVGPALEKGLIRHRIQLAIFGEGETSDAMGNMLFESVISSALSGIIGDERAEEHISKTRLRALDYAEELLKPYEATP